MSHMRSALKTASLILLPLTLPLIWLGAGALLLWWVATENALWCRILGHDEREGWCDRCVRRIGA